MARISSLETFATPFVCFVRLTTDDGQEGWGQCSTYHADITATIFHRQVAPHVIGRDAFGDIAATVLHVEEKEHKFPGSHRARAIAGLDTALWDLHGKAKGVPVTALIGGTPGRVRAYASSMKRDITPEDEAARFLRLRDRHGFTAFKWRVGAECGHDGDEWPGRTEAVIPVVSKALGDGIDKLVDGNSGFSPARAIAVGRMLEDYGIGHFEEPCPYWEMEQTKAVADALSIDVAGGEQDCEIGLFARMIDMRAVDVVQPDVLYMGGLARTLAVCRLAAAARMPVTPHAANLGLVTLCTMHLLRAIPNAGKYLEFSIEGPDYYPWQEGLFRGDPYRIDDGQATVTDAPGWGVEVNPAWLEGAARQVTGRDRPAFGRV